ncbi:MAG: hypothetical protein ACPG5B_06840 [Chitinophagales bacterium]
MNIDVNHTSKTLIEAEIDKRLAKLTQSYSYYIAILEKLKAYFAKNVSYDDSTLLEFDDKIELYNELIRAFRQVRSGNTDKMYNIFKGFDLADIQENYICIVESDYARLSKKDVKKANDFDRLIQYFNELVAFFEPKVK